jgi:hypothetical protein
MGEGVMGPGESSMADEGEEVTKAGNEAVLNVRSSDVVLTSSASIPSFRITDHVRGGIISAWSLWPISGLLLHFLEFLTQHHCLSRKLRSIQSVSESIHRV